MASLFVVTSINNVKHMAGIPHPHAIANIDGAAIFGFRKLPVAARFAKVLDERIASGTDFVFSEDLIEPFSHLKKFQNLELKGGYREVAKNVMFDHVLIGKVKEHEVANYCSALNISAVLLGEMSPSGTVYVEDILSPGRSMEFSAGFLNYLYNEAEFGEEEISNH
jgi:hypothetical protein